MNLYIDAEIQKVWKVYWNCWNIVSDMKDVSYSAFCSLSQIVFVFSVKFNCKNCLYNVKRL